MRKRKSTYFGSSLAFDGGKIFIRVAKSHKIEGLVNGQMSEAKGSKEKETQKCIFVTKWLSPLYTLYLTC